VSRDIKKQRRERVGIKMGIPKGGCKKVQKTLSFFVIKQSMMVAHCHVTTGNG
jgi:Fe-S cluster assembly iron-binding protein IscA